MLSSGKPGKQAAVVCPVFLAGQKSDIFTCVMYIVQCTMYIVNVFFEGQFSEREKYIFLHVLQRFLCRSTESLDKKKKYGLPARPFKFGRS